MEFYRNCNELQVMLGTLQVETTPSIPIFYCMKALQRKKKYLEHGHRTTSEYLPQSPIHAKLLIRHTHIGLVSLQQVRER